MHTYDEGNPSSLRVMINKYAIIYIILSAFCQGLIAYLGDLGSTGNTPALVPIKTRKTNYKVKISLLMHLLNLAIYPTGPIIILL